MNEAKIKEVFSDEQFVKELLEFETPESVQSALIDKDIDVTLEDIVKTRELLARYNSGELSEEDLESVTGGGILAVLGFTLGLLTISTFIGLCETRTRW